MKKTYIKPTIEAMNISMQSMIAASGIIFDDNGGSGSLNDDDAAAALARELLDF